MKVPQDVREFTARQAAAERGMAEKSAEFREKGGEVYLPVGEGAPAAVGGMPRRQVAVRRRGPDSVPSLPSTIG